MGTLSQVNSTMATSGGHSEGSGAVPTPPDDHEMRMPPELLEMQRDSAGYIEIDAHRTNYVGSAHWKAILKNVRLA